MSPVAHRTGNSPLVADGYRFGRTQAGRELHEALGELEHDRGDMTTGIEVMIRPATARFDAEDQRWLDQVADLVTGLCEDVGAVSQRRVPEPGTKGAVGEVILTLGSAGAITAAVECFRAWLRRDKFRTLTVSWAKDDGIVQTVTVTGDGIDQASFQALAEAIGRGLGS